MPLAIARRRGQLRAAAVVNLALAAMAWGTYVASDAMGSWGLRAPGMPRGDGRVIGPRVIRYDISAGTASHLMQPERRAGDVGLQEEARAHADFMSSSLPAPLLSLLESMKRKDDDAPVALWITGLPEEAALPDAPPCPHDLSAAPRSRTHLLGLSCLLGVPYTFSGFHGESIVQDVFPRTEDLHKASVYGAAVDLPMHREFALSPPPIPCEFLLFSCLRAAPPPTPNDADADADSDADADADAREKGETLVVCNEELFEGVESDGVGHGETESERRSESESESESDFAVAGPPRTAAAGWVPRGGRIKLEMDWRFKNGQVPTLEMDMVEGEVGNRQVNLFHPGFLPGSTMEGNTLEAEQAYWALGRRAMDRATAVPMAPGDVLIVDNRRAVHGRRRFNVREDGKGNRWLQRVYVGSSEALRPHLREGSNNVLPVRYFSHEPVALRK